MPADAKPTVIIGVGAGIAAYKVGYVVRGLRALGWRTHVIPTPASLNFVGAQTWAELSENPVDPEVFTTGPYGHVRLAREADLIVLAPATADLLAKAAVGLAGDMLTATLLASPAPVIAFPAMHTQMWLNEATQSNVSTLRKRGWTVVDPLDGPLSSGDTGPGRLPEPQDIVDHVEAFQSALNTGCLAGKKIVITAGGTQEPLDPVRFLGNRSSGLQGIELARAAVNMGAQVDLVVANVAAKLPPESAQLRVIQAPSASQMLEAVENSVKTADALIMAAAVADFTPAVPATQKIKKQGSDPLTLELVQTPDILLTIAGSDQRPPVLVGFGAETGTLEEVLFKGAAKARKKTADLLAVNRVGEGLGFGDVDNTLVLLDAGGDQVGELTGSKKHLARELLGLVCKRLKAKESS